MKKILYTFFVFLLSLTLVSANEVSGMKYKDIKLKSKITYDENGWSYAKKSDNYFIKTEGFGDYYDYLNKDKSYAFTTDCKYEFLYNKKLIGYSDKDFVFYEFDYSNGVLTRKPVPEEEIKNFLSGYRIVKLSEFSPYTNSLKIKKGLGSLRLLVLNDIGIDMTEYGFTSGNMKFETFSIAGAVRISSAGMLQLSKDGAKSSQIPWFVILVR